MGVMPCYRKDCDNILCDTYIDDGGIGYICNECIAEFQNKNQNLTTKGEITQELIKFMETSKHTSSDETCNVYKFFEKNPPSTF